ncbi:thioesterase family protein [Ignisphaera sp. 4213-co]|uniref:Thioesterase family protein n=1 Tax=Ignisphaera cupida TaxID=3050454 RepID=A0ABD4Z7P2_9CREN|nr:thioesterase family protein [Ignisphaera sp. 4213-co]MDK6028133.1 thioesterase family protein [Ignisphaera sp. 4213-co]
MSYEDLVELIPTGITCIEDYKIGDEHIAKHVNVLATPMMILFMEVTASKCIEKYIPVGYTTVGFIINVKHVNPAPSGATIRIEVKLVSKEGRRLMFEVKAFWKNVLVGEGVHERYVVDVRRFLDKVRRLIG